jgi:mycofactocin system glycosyltransferase
MSALLPCGFGLTMDPTTKKLQLGGVLMGGSPLRILRLSPRAAVLAAEWDAGATVGRRRSEQLLARRLVSSGIFVPRPAAPTLRPDDVTVVVPVRDRPEQLERLLASLQGLACIVVDDASPDAARTEDLAHAAHATFIGLATNAGPSAARNAGLAAAATPLVAFIDSDCVPEEGWLTSLLGHFDDPLVGAVAPRVLPLAVSPPTWLTRYEATRSSLDRGAGEGLVRPLSRIPYVPVFGEARMSTWFGEWSRPAGTCGTSRPARFAMKVRRLLLPGCIGERSMGQRRHRCRGGIRRHSRH